MARHCPACGAAVAADDNYCEACGAGLPVEGDGDASAVDASSSSGYGHLLVGVGMVAVVLVGALLVFGIIGVAAFGPDGDASVDNAEGDVTVETETPTPTATPDPHAHDMGESFVVGDGEKRTRYTVTDAWVEPDPDRDDREYIYVNVTATNVAKESFTLSANVFAVTDTKHRHYDAYNTIRFVDFDDMMGQTLKPDLTESGTLYFQVPVEQTDRQLLIEPAGTFSTAANHTVDLDV